jgi:regulator of protease activity HflC (stomatin/prohibitin superfamily)
LPTGQEGGSPHSVLGVGCTTLPERRPVAFGPWPTVCTRRGWMRTVDRLALAVILLGASAGCAAAVIEPGHRGLMFDPKHLGLEHQVLAPGYYHLTSSARVVDYDVTYSTHAETIAAVTKEGLRVDMKFSVIYRPMIPELYELQTEIGPNYFDEILGPQFRSAAREVCAMHSYIDLTRRGGTPLEDEIEASTRRRIAGKHIELASVTLESAELPPDLVAVVRAREIARQNALKEDADRAREKAVAQEQWEKEKLELEHEVERRRLQREAEGRYGARSKGTSRSERRSRCESEW